MHDRFDEQLLVEHAALRDVRRRRDAEYPLVRQQPATRASRSFGVPAARFGFGERLARRLRGSDAGTFMEGNALAGALRLPFARAPSPTRHVLLPPSRCPTTPIMSLVLQL